MLVTILKRGEGWEGRIALRSVELSVSHQPIYGYPLHVLHLAVILSLLIITTILHGFCSQDMLSDIALPLLPALWWQKQDLVAQKKWSRQLKSML